MKKLVLWKNCINNRNYDCFETLQTFIIEIEAKVDDDIISDISAHSRFRLIGSPVNWVSRLIGPNC